MPRAVGAHSGTGAIQAFVPYDGSAAVTSAILAAAFEEGLIGGASLDALGAPLVDEVVDRGTLVGVGAGLDDGAGGAGDLVEGPAVIVVGRSTRAT